MDDMFLAGLSQTLLEALDQLATHIPSLLASMQSRLLRSITTVLADAAAQEASNDEEDLSLVPHSCTQVCDGHHPKPILSLRQRTPEGARFVSLYFTSENIT